MKGRSHPQCGVLRDELLRKFLAPLRLCVRSSYNGRYDRREEFCSLCFAKEYRCSPRFFCVARFSDGNDQKYATYCRQACGAVTHINIEVGEKSATIEYDCASGVINGPLVVDSNGNFKLRGTIRWNAVDL